MHEKSLNTESHRAMQCSTLCMGYHHLSVLMSVLVLTWEQDLWLLKLVSLMFMHLIMEDHVMCGTADMIQATAAWLMLMLAAGT